MLLYLIFYNLSSLLKRKKLTIFKIIDSPPKIRYKTVSLFANFFIKFIFRQLIFYLQIYKYNLLYLMNFVKYDVNILLQYLK